MLLTHLRLINFRNHRHSELAPGPGVNFLVGANAQGKSAIVEAAWVAATGRSQRARRDGDLIRLGQTWARVRAAVQRIDRRVELDVVWRWDQAEALPVRPQALGPPLGGSGLWKELRVNGVPARRGELLGQLLVVAATPQDEQVLSGGPAWRRRLLEILLAQLSPSYYYLSTRYGRAVAQRNQLLRTPRRGEMEAWDEQVAHLGAAITVRRREAVSRLAPAATAAYTALCRSGESLEVSYQAAIPGEDETAMAKTARAQLVQRRGEEMARGATLVGPHRDDLRLTVGGRDLREFGSRGEHQAAMLAVRLAERQLLREESGEDPVLLLDDTLLALDEQRQANLLALLGDVQALITVPSLASVRDLPSGSAVFRVEAGTVAPVATPAREG